MRSRRSFRAIRTLAGPLLAFLAVFAQTALPVVHEWEVGLREAAEHPVVARVASGSAITSPEDGSSHEHHDAACAVCRVLSNARHLSSPRIVVSVISPLASALPAVVVSRASTAADLDVSGPRAPPAVS
jgi:hypothetical protein